MADLETTAPETLVAVRRLEARITEANARLNELRKESLDAVEAQCESAWSDLERRVTTFLQQVADQRAVLHELGRDTQGTMAGAREDLNEAYIAAQSQLQEAASRISRLQEDVAAVEPEVALLLEGLQASAHSLEQQLAAAESELDQAVQATCDFIGTEVAGELRAMQTEIEERAAAVRQTIVEEGQARVEAAEADWDEKLVEVFAMVEAAFIGTADHAEKVTAFSMEACRKAFDEAFQELKAAADTIETVLQAFRQEAEDAQIQSGIGTEALDAAILETIDALGGATSIVESVLVELARYSWGSL
jgi:DNA repair exonuclease SbcCD ATPase subunit